MDAKLLYFLSAVVAAIAVMSTSQLFFLTKIHRFAVLALKLNDCSAY